MRAYGMSYSEVMGMPIRAFWTISGFVERLQADEAKLTLQVHMASATSDQKSREEFWQALEVQAPAPIVYSGLAKMKASEARDKDASTKLRRLAG